MIYKFLLEYLPKDIVKYIIEEYIYPSQVYCDGCLTYNPPGRSTQIRIYPCKIEDNYCDNCIYPISEFGYHKVKHTSYSYFVREYKKKYLPKEYEYTLSLDKALEN